MDFQTIVKKHYFWILFGVAIILVPTGWWLGTSKLAAKTKERIAEIEAANNGIPNPAGHPNDEKWTKPMIGVNKVRTTHHYKEAMGLWKMQRGTMKWPTAVAHVMGDRKFFEDPKGAIANRSRSTYNDIYIQEAKRVWEIVHPMKQNKETGEWNNGLVMFGFQEKNSGNAGGAGVVGGNRNSSGGLVAGGGMGDGGGGGTMSANGMMPRVPDSAWQSRPPTFQEMWKAQLDLWLLESLLKSINRVNQARGAKSIYDAPIVEIAHISLHGGNRKALEESRSSAGSSGESNTDDGVNTAPGGKGNYPGGTSQPGGLLGGNKQDGAGTGTTDGSGARGNFGNLPLPNPVDIFGPPQIEGAEESGETDNDTSGDAGKMMTSGPTGAQGSGAQGADILPWVDNDPEMPFKTRGFMLKVLMKRTDVTLLIQELTDARETRYPVEILWINGVDKDVDHRGDKVVIRYGAGNVGGAVGGYGSGPMGEGGCGPMPGVGGRFGSQPMGGKSSGSAGGTGTTGNVPFKSALEDSSLGYVVIAGLMTVYQEPKKPEADPNANAGSNDTMPKTSKQPNTKDPGGKTPAGKNPGFIENKKKDPAKQNPPKSKAAGQTTPKKKDSGFKPDDTKTKSTTKPKPANNPDTSKKPAVPSKSAKKG